MCLSHIKVCIVLDAGFFYLADTSMKIQIIDIGGKNNVAADRLSRFEFQKAIIHAPWIEPKMTYFSRSPTYQKLAVTKKKLLHASLSPATRVSYLKHLEHLQSFMLLYHSESLRQNARYLLMFCQIVLRFLHQNVTHPAQLHSMFARLGRCILLKKCW